MSISVVIFGGILGGLWRMSLGPVGPHRTWGWIGVGIRGAQDPRFFES